MDDVYDFLQYGKLNEIIECGENLRFEYLGRVGKVVDQFIVREIPIRVDGERFYDVITPYGYGGPRVVGNVTGKAREELIKDANKSFIAFCNEKNIVAQFVRFHPLYDNALDWQACFDVLFSRKTVAVDLEDANYSMHQFTATCRNKIRKAEKKGVRIVIDKACSEIEAFKELYYKTMQKNSASEFYWFPDTYFAEMINQIGDNVLLIHAYLDDKVIGSSLFLEGDMFLHNHLSATDPEYYAYAANNAILAASVEYGHKKGLKWMHMGRGLSGQDNDPLLEFKRSFGKNSENLKDFYIGKRILNHPVYDRLVELRAAENPEFDRKSPYFPLYRA